MFSINFVGNIRLQVVTVATKPVDGYERFMHSAELFHLDVEVYLFRLLIVTTIIQLLPNLSVKTELTQNS